MEVKKKIEKKIPTLKGMNKHGNRREFPLKMLKEKISPIAEDIDLEEIRRITYDSVYDEKNYRVVISKFISGKKVMDIFSSTNWEYEQAIVKEDKKTYVINQEYEVDLVEKSYLDEIHTSKAKTVEGRVYIIIDGYGYNITKHARKEAKSLYEDILKGEGG